MRKLKLESDYIQEKKLGRVFVWYMRILAVLGYSWLIINGVYILLKDTSAGYSLIGVGAYMASLTSYLGYGVLKNDIVIKTSSTVGIFANIFVLSCIFVVNKPAWS